MSEDPYKDALRAMRIASESGDTEGARRMAAYAQTLKSKESVPQDVPNKPTLEEQQETFEQPEKRRLGGAFGRALEKKRPLTGAAENAMQLLSATGGMTVGGVAGVGSLVIGEGGQKARERIEATTEMLTTPVRTETGKDIQEAIMPAIQWLDEKTFQAGTITEDIPVIGPTVSTGIKIGLDVLIGVATGRLMMAGVSKARAKSIANATVRADREATKIRNDIANKNFGDMQQAKTNRTTPDTTTDTLVDRSGVVEGRKKFIREYIKNSSGTGMGITERTKQAKSAWRSHIKRSFREQDAIFDSEVKKLEARRRAAPINRDIQGKEVPIDLPDVPKIKKIQERAESVANSAGNFLGTIIAKLDAIDPTKLLGKKQRFMEWNIESKMVARNEIAGDFYKISKKMYKGPLAGNWHKAALNQDWARMKALAIQAGVKPNRFTHFDGDYDTIFASARGVLNQMGGEALDSGFKGFRLIEDYIPRHISDKNLKILAEDPELQILLGPDKMDKLKKVFKQDFDDMSTKQEALNAALTGGGTAKVPVVTAQQSKRRGKLLGEEFYEPVHVSLQRYVNDMTESIEIRRFLGKNKADLGESLGAFVDDNASVLGLGGREQMILKNVLETRFKEGRMHPARTIGTLKNYGYITSIGNVWSALTQIGDVLAGAKLFPVKTVLGGLADSLTPGKGIKPKDVGYEAIMKEMADASTSAKWLDWTLRYSGFTMVDKLGKTSIVNASRRNWMNKAKTEKGRAKIEKEWAGMFKNDPTELAKFIDDLKVGNLNNENVKFAIFNDLADLQPITLSDMPLNYLRHPNGRILWALKTWSAQQMNTLYRMSVQESKRGNHLEAAKNVMKYGAYTVALGTVGIDVFKTWLAKWAAGEQLKPEDIADETVDGVLRQAFISKYAVETSRAGTDIWHHITNVFAPTFQGTVIRAERALKKDKNKDKAKEISKILPLVGPALGAIDRAKKDD